MGVVLFCLFDGCEEGRLGEVRLIGDMAKLMRAFLLAFDGGWGTAAAGEAGAVSKVA